MSLLIGGLAYGPGSGRDEHVKVAVLVGSLAAAALAAVVLRLRNRVYRAIALEEQRDEDGDGVPDCFEPAAGAGGGRGRGRAPLRPPCGRRARLTPRESVGSGVPASCPAGQTSRSRRVTADVDHQSRTSVGTTDRTPERTLGQLVVDATNDVSSIVRSEITLAKAEISADAKVAGKGAGMFGGAGLSRFPRR